MQVVIMETFPYHSATLITTVMILVLILLQNSLSEKTGLQCLKLDSMVNMDANLSTEKNFWSCPASVPEKENSSTRANEWISLGMNDGWTNLTDRDKYPLSCPDANWFHNPPAIVKFPSASQTVLGSDVRAGWMVYTWRWFPVTPGTPGPYIIRHKNGANFVMVDGHVEYGQPENELEAKSVICRPRRFKYDYNNLP